MVCLHLAGKSDAYMTDTSQRVITVLPSRNERDGLTHLCKLLLIELMTDVSSHLSYIIM